MKTWFKSISIALLLIAQTTFAHHSVYGRFDVDKLQKIRGEFRDAELINPHSWFHFYEVDASGARVMKDGKPVLWSFETPAPAMLRRMGITDKIYQPGAIYTIYLSPQLDGDTKGLMTVTVFPDGKVLVIGNKEDVRVKAVLQELNKTS